MQNRPNSLGEAIRLLRAGRSQAEVAERADLDAAAWSAYEGGRRRPEERNFERIVRGLGCTRLELEETAWNIRRRQLLEAQRGDGADRQGGKTAPRLPYLALSPDPATECLLDLFERLTAAVESLNRRFAPAEKK